MMLSVSTNNSYLLPPEAFRDVAKMNNMLKLLETFPVGTKTLIFSGFTEVLDIAGIVLNDAGINIM